MVRFSCFQGHIHSHKHKKSMRLSSEIMQKTSEDSSKTRALENVSCLATEKNNYPKDEEDSHCTADHTTDSSPTERECKSEELASKFSADCNLEVHGNPQIRKSQSLGSGLNWVETTSCADGSEGEADRRISSDESANKSGIVPSNSGLGLQDQFQEPEPSDSIRVNSDCEKYMSIFSIADPQQYEDERALQDDLCLSGEVKSDDCALHNTPPVIAKSNSLPDMTSPRSCSPSLLRCCRSVEDLNASEFGKKHTSHEIEREIQYQEGFNTVLGNDTMNSEENPADETYEYVASAKDWIVPALDGANEEIDVKGEASLSPLAEGPPKDFRLKRIEDWVNNLQHYSPLKESEDFPLYNDDSSKGKAVMEEQTAVKSEVKINPGAEAAKKYISSLNASATAAQLTNLGLVVIPFFSAFVSIKALNLSGNAIVRITAGALPRGLHILNLSRNNISTIEGLRELTRLRVLDLSYNRIVRIGHGLSSCSSLKELYLAGNKISEVEGLHRLLKLNILDLRFNKISTTKCLGQLAANYNCLQALSLEGNPALKNIGEEPLKKYVQSLLPHLTYYNRQPINKIGATMKDSSDRSARLGIAAHQIDRGLRADVKKGAHGVVSHKVSSSSSSVHGRKSHLNPHKTSRGSRHGARPPPPSGTRLSTQGHQFAAAEFGSKLMGLRNDFLRSRSEGNMGAL